MDPSERDRWITALTAPDCGLGRIAGEQAFEQRFPDAVRERAVLELCEAAGRLPDAAETQLGLLCYWTTRLPWSPAWIAQARKALRSDSAKQRSNLLNAMRPNNDSPPPRVTPPELRGDVQRILNTDADEWNRARAIGFVQEWPGGLDVIRQYLKNNAADREHRRDIESARFSVWYATAKQPADFVAGLDSPVLSIQRFCVGQVAKRPDAERILLEYANRHRGEATYHYGVVDADNAVKWIRREKNPK